MATKVVFFCKNCGYESVKWQGKCPSCEEWNSFTEEPISKSSNKKSRKTKIDNTALKLSEVKPSSEFRLELASSELNRVLGGGLVGGSVVLVSGEPGIGKSTLFLQLAVRQNGEKILYISGEESLEQIKLRSQRLNQTNEEVYLLNETSTDQIIHQADKTEPAYLIIDSIQTIRSPHLDSAPGSISQIRESSAEIIEYAKQNNIAVFLIGHINKDGNIAGPKLLEHMVDVVLHFEGDRNYNYRIIRSSKNRYGATSEIGVYEMADKGLVEIKNISALLLSANSSNTSGNSVASVMEGTRPMLIDTQALVSNSSYGQPQRTANGFDQRRLQLLLAVLEKRGEFNFSNKDVFLNMAGNLRVEDPAVDLSVCVALVSSLLDSPIPATSCFAGEVGLSGEIRPVAKIEARIAEAEKLGFQKFYYASHSKLSKKNFGLDLIKISDVGDLMNLVGI